MVMVVSYTIHEYPSRNTAMKADLAVSQNFLLSELFGLPVVCRNVDIMLGFRTVAIGAIFVPALVGERRGRH